jgi:hypothetical protein
MLLPASDRDTDAEILALRHQVTVLQRQLGTTRPQFSPADRAFLAAYCTASRATCSAGSGSWWPDTVLSWHRDLLVRRHAARSRPGHPGRPRTILEEDRADGAPTWADDHDRGNPPATFAGGFPRSHESGTQVRCRPIRCSRWWRLKS